jgi:VanZ family protein
MLQKLYRYLFWSGYLAVLITAFLPVTGELNKIYFGPKSFHIRLDHLLHLIVYFLICMYYLFGLLKRITLFKKNSLLKFVLLIFFLATVSEVVQLWVPDRAFNPLDWMANVAGVLIGVLVIIMAQRYKGLKA